jgi:hypothetical protein
MLHRTDTVSMAILTSWKKQETAKTNVGEQDLTIHHIILNANYNRFFEGHGFSM